MAQVPKRLTAKFKNLVKSLDQLIKEVRQYEPDAALYVTPQQFTLVRDIEVTEDWTMQESNEIAQCDISHMDCGDW